MSKWTVRCSNNPPWTPTANFLVLSLRYIVSSLVFHSIQLRRVRFAPGSKTDGQTLASQKNNSYQVVLVSAESKFHILTITYDLQMLEEASRINITYLYVTTAVPKTNGSDTVSSSVFSVYLRLKAPSEN